MAAAVSIRPSCCTKGGKEGWVADRASHKSGQNFDLLGQAQIHLVSIWHIAMEIYFSEGTSQAQICEVRIVELNVAIEKN